MNRHETFTERLHAYGKSQLFLGGILLWSIGSVADFVLSFSAGDIITFIGIVMIVIGLSMIYFSSKNPKTPEKTLVSITLFKVVVIVQLVLFCIGMSLAVLMLLIFGVTGTVLAEGNVVAGVSVLIFMTFAVIFAVMIYFYFISLLRILKSIRDGITYNIIKPLRGVTPFSVFMYISTAFSFLTTILSLVLHARIAIFFNEFLQKIINQLTFLPAMGQSIYDMLIEELTGFMMNPARISAGQWIGAILTFAVGIGVILCVVTLTKFNNSLKR